MYDVSGIVLEVVGSFLKKEKGVGGPLTSDGKRLLSYGVVIAQWLDGGKAIVLTGGRSEISRTTNRHRDLVRRMAAGAKVALVDENGLGKSS
jgi:hypothetical protein